MLDRIEGEAAQSYDPLTGYARGLLRRAINHAEKSGEIPRSMEELQPHAEAIRDKQLERLERFGFHKELGQSCREYEEGFPQFLPQPEEYKARFDIPLVVETRIPLLRQHKLAGINEFIDIDYVTNLTSVPSRHLIPSGPMMLAPLPQCKRTASARALCPPDDEVGSPLVEVTALYLQRPDIFKDHGVDAPGSRLPWIPSLRILNGKSWVDNRWPEDQNESWGALSRGKQINTKT